LIDNTSIKNNNNNNNNILLKTKTAMRSCRTRKRALHLYSPGVIQRSHDAARQVPARWHCCMAVAAALQQRRRR